MPLYNLDNIQNSALNTIDSELETIKHLKSALTNEFSEFVVRILDIKGRLIVTGIGKSFIIARKIAATLNSTGTKAMVLHAADAIHGDLGMVDKEDIVLALSKSGETPEIKNLVTLIKQKGNTLAAIVSDTDSFLAQASDYVLHIPVEREACPNDLAPTSSTTAQLVMGDALAVALLEQRGFSSEQFAENHPGGMLGKQLNLTVDTLIEEDSVPMNTAESPLAEVLTTMSRYRKGCTVIVDDSRGILGIITDGDIRRTLQKGIVDSTLTAADIMSAEPKRIEMGSLALKALHLMQENKVSQIIIQKENKLKGVIHIQDILKEGLT